MAIPHAFFEALPSSNRAPELSHKDDLFGYLIGSWELEAVLYGANGQIQTSKGELHASRVLEGRAIHDLFIFPRRADRGSGTPTHGDRYATTIRTLDRTLNAWRVYFINPVADETSAQLIAQRVGNDIAMEGKLRDATSIRWRYTAITANSFHCTAEKLQQDGSCWHPYLDWFGTRSISDYLLEAKSENDP
jgi:hypothetical protein